MIEILIRASARIDEDRLPFNPDQNQRNPDLVRGIMIRLASKIVSRYGAHHLSSARSRGEVMIRAIVIVGKPGIQHGSPVHDLHFTRHIGSGEWAQ